MEPYSVDYDYYYNSKDRPQEASSNRKNFHAITFPNVIVFLIQNNNDYTVYSYKKFPLLLPLMSRICNLWADVKREFSYLGEKLSQPEARLACGYGEKGILKVCFAQCRNLPLIGVGYIKAATIKIMTKTKASLKSRT